MADGFRLVPRILSCYPAPFPDAKVVPLGNRGGFSGASIWRVEVAGQAYCLRAWPVRQSDPARLGFIHSLMRQARDSGLSFVPALIATVNGQGFVTSAGQLWDLTEWLAGQADFQARPSPARLQNACVALARLHRAWENRAISDADFCPALQRRLAAAAEWQKLVRIGWQPCRPANAADPVQAVAERAWRHVSWHIDDVERRLRPWLGRRWRLQPCLCDVWHDHLLFEGDHLTGVIDYGAAKIDHPAVDLARLLGSLVPDQPAFRQTGLDAYRTIRRFDDDESDLALALDRTGIVIGTATWLRWLYEEFRPFEDRAAVARRLELLVRRLEQWSEE